MTKRTGWALGIGLLIVALVFAVAVSPTFERQGLATRLCEDVIQRFGAMGVGVVRTMVRREAVPMLALFRSMGFSGGPFCELERPVGVQVEGREGAA